MPDLSQDAERIARAWLVEPQGDPMTAPLRYAIQLLLEEAEDKIQRLKRQRDQAWQTLARIERAIGRTTPRNLAIILADGHGPEDVEEWNRVILGKQPPVVPDGGCLRCGDHDAMTEWNAKLELRVAELERGQWEMGP